jgi:hypothetical protein
MLNRTSFATVSATATRAYADASAIAISPTPNTQEAYKKLSKDIWNPTDRPVFSDSRCLVFGRCGCGVKNSNERSRPPLSGECRLKRLVAGVSGYICDQA